MTICRKLKNFFLRLAKKEKSPCHCKTHSGERASVCSLTVSVSIGCSIVKNLSPTLINIVALQPEGKGTVVTWSMLGKNNFIGKAMDLIMNCDKGIVEKKQ